MELVRRRRRTRSPGAAGSSCASELLEAVRRRRAEPLPAGRLEPSGPLRALSRPAGSRPRRPARAWAWPSASRMGSLPACSHRRRGRCRAGSAARWGAAASPGAERLEDLGLPRTRGRIAAGPDRLLAAAEGRLGRPLPRRDGSKSASSNPPSALVRPTGPLPGRAGSCWSPRPTSRACPPSWPGRKRAAAGSSAGRSRSATSRCSRARRGAARRLPGPLHRGSAGALSATAARVRR